MKVTPKAINKPPPITTLMLPEEPSPDITIPEKTLTTPMATNNLLRKILIIFITSKIHHSTQNSTIVPFSFCDISIQKFPTNIKFS